MMSKFFIFTLPLLVSCFNKNPSNEQRKEFIKADSIKPVQFVESQRDCNQSFIGIFKNFLVFDNFKLNFLELHNKEGKIDTLHYPKHLSADYAFQEYISFSEKEYKGGITLYDGSEWKIIQADIKNYFYYISNNKLFYNDNTGNIFIFDMKTSTTILSEERGRIKVTT